MVTLSTREVTAGSLEAVGDGKPKCCLPRGNRELDVQGARPQVWPLGFESYRRDMRVGWPKTEDWLAQVPAKPWDLGCDWYVGLNPWL